MPRIDVTVGENYFDQIWSYTTVHQIRSSDPRVQIIVIVTARKEQNQVACNITNRVYFFKYVLIAVQIGTNICIVTQRE